ncbi:MAG: hydrolase, partial [Burkholderiales bacterium]|nr:hydrolase [Burkholderiales bacterium]
SQGQVLAYLYDVDDLGIGTLISHGARSVHTATAGQTISYPIGMHMAAYTVPAGHHLSLVLDTQDAHYAPASNSTFGMDFMFSSSLLSSLTIPYIN